MKLDDLALIIKSAAKEIWENNISTDYQKGRLHREASLQSSFYYHLRNKIGDSTLDFYNAAIYSEYRYKGKRVDLAVIAFDKSGQIIPLAIFEFKYKGITSDQPFLEDVDKILKYIDNEDNCTFYLGFIQDAEFADLDDKFSWLNNKQTKKASNRLIEMTGGLYRTNEETVVWNFKEVGNKT
jgi:hypothetical protein